MPYLYLQFPYLLCFYCIYACRSIGIIGCLISVNDYQQEAFNPRSYDYKWETGWLKMSNGLKIPYTEENIGRCMCPECPVLAAGVWVRN
ncbi:hypothetical protein MNV_80032 [Candidatus Methanoperedens nitroreducens]|uniref:Uncharacterized protein n=1 Tax=Candidatus Methanoperedens nitratireducens TaxID=1392998 RepID=A0A284VTJ9_9EURY|nr:hypothetical protein MNV_80032 [Candidatus Methanoperedens nitroreducens]